MPNRQSSLGVVKPHPASRAVEPEDPLELQGTAVPGDPEQMLEVLVEEFAQIGWTSEQILHLADNPFYQAFYGLKRLLGDEAFRRTVRSVLGRCGVMRTVAHEQLCPVQPQLTQLIVAPGLRDPIHPNGADHHGSSGQSAIFEEEQDDGAGL